MAAQTQAKFGPKFQALLDKAKQGDGHLRAGLSAFTPVRLKFTNNLTWQKRLLSKARLPARCACSNKEKCWARLSCQTLGRV